ncbi:MAG: MtrB/PioB family outer membrane beta-barrel protein [Terriglobales bacterium]
MKKTHSFLLLAVLVVAVPLTLWSQDKPPEAAAADTVKAEPAKADTAKAESQPVDTAEPGRNFAEFGVRHTWGEVYGRPDLPFTPDFRTSKYNEYRDVRNGFFLRRFRMHMDEVFGTNSYLNVQAESAVYRDQSYLATIGQFGRYKVQFRYDQVPHIYTNTARTLYVQSAPGVWTIANSVRSQLQSISTSNTMPNIIQTQIVPSMGFITPRIVRRAGSVKASWDVTSDWNLNGSYFREHSGGTRPIGAIFNSSPSASLTGGYGVEVPEVIDYFHDRVTAGTEYQRGRIGMQIGYLGSFFQNNTGTLTFDNPWRTTDCIAPTGCTNANQGPAAGRMDLYPDNRAHYFTFALIAELSKRWHFLASIQPGLLRQSDPFIPYTINALRLAQTGPLPTTNLGGDKQTLAMTYSLVGDLPHALQVKGSYRQYDYNNNTPVHTFTAIIADLTAPTTFDTLVFAYNRKNVELTGNWRFWNKSSFKAGYEGEWMNRENRDVDHSVEHSLMTALDLNPMKDMNFRIGYRRSMRDPKTYDDHFFHSTTGGVTESQVDSRRFDEAHRIREKVEAQFSYELTDRFGFSAFAGTLQDDYNLPGGTNRTTPLNFIPGTTNPYYIYGVLKDINFNYGVDMDFVLHPAATLFAEYSHERYHKRMASRYRVPGGAVPLPMDCGTSGRACDSPNNDWESTARERVDIFSVGTDFTLGKNAFFTTFYSLSAATGNVNSRPLGDPTLTTGVNRFLLIGTIAAVPYPQTTHRFHDLGVVLKYRITKNLAPKFEYRYEQADLKDYQTSPMTPYMGCVSALAPAATVPGCTNRLLGTPSVFYPYAVIGDTGAARQLFLGADQPSYKVHRATFTLEYRF